MLTFYLIVSRHSRFGIPPGQVPPAPTLSRPLVPCFPSSSPSFSPFTRERPSAPKHNPRVTSHESPVTSSFPFLPPFTHSASLTSSNFFALNLFADPHPLNPVPSIFYKNAGGERSHPTLPTLSRISHLPYTVPSSLSCKSFACHSYENTGDLWVDFPFWNTSLAIRVCPRHRDKKHVTTTPLKLCTLSRIRLTPRFSWGWEFWADSAGVMICVTR